MCVCARLHACLCLCLPVHARPIVSSRCPVRAEAKREPTAVVFPLSAVVSTAANWPHRVTADKAADKQLNSHYFTLRAHECVCVCVFRQISYVLTRPPHGTSFGFISCVHLVKSPKRLGRGGKSWKATGRTICPFKGTNQICYC